MSIDQCLHMSVGKYAPRKGDRKDEYGLTGTVNVYELIYTL